MKNLRPLSQNKTWLETAIKYNRLIRHELTFGPPKKIKHNPSKDKRFGLAKSHLKVHTKSAHCNDTLWKERIYKNQTEKTFTAIAGKRANYRLSRRVQCTRHLPRLPAAPNHHQQPQIRPEKRGITLTRWSGKQVPQHVQAMHPSRNSDTTAAWDSRTGMRWLRQLGSAWREMSDENT
jgi:hypothetical protein